MKKFIMALSILTAFFCGIGYSYFQTQGGAGHSNPWSLPGVSLNNFNTGNFIDDEYDLRVGNNDSASVARIGNLEFGTCDDRTVGTDLTMGGVVLFAVQNVPDGVAEFIWTTAGGDVRQGLPRSGDGLGSYNARSGMYAGPSVLRDSIFYGRFWGFNRLAMNTTDLGADLGVQNCIQVGDSCYINTNIIVGGNQFINQSDSTTIDPDKIETTGNVVFSVTAGITATNPGVQGDSPLTKDVNEISTVGAGDDAVTLPVAAAGLEIFIINNGANQLEIWPASGDNAGGGVDTAVTLASGSNATYVAIDGTNWEVK